MSTRLPRWTGLLALPMLVGALLLMHGLDARAHAGESHEAEATASAAVPADHSHDESAPAEHAHCLDCLAGPVMVACVAIITVIGACGLVRRRATRSGPAVRAMAAAGRMRGRVELARPPDPAWVRLSVMLC